MAFSGLEKEKDRSDLITCKELYVPFSPPGQVPQVKVVFQTA